MIALARVDNRLIHGQVVSTWIPHVKAQDVVVADEEAAGSSLMQMAMTMAVPPPVEVRIAAPADIDWASLAKSPRRVLVLLRDVAAAAAARRAGLEVGSLNLGNVHFADGRRPLLASVFLSEPELRLLDDMAREGVEIEARAVPADPKVSLAELWNRYRSRG
jgi:mannose/fructose/N-acetylgalactosamine-specific phosphotransferase system component IIB